MKRLFQLLNASCEEIAALVSAGLDRDLSGAERFAVHLHLLYCKACRRYRRQILLLRQTLRRMASLVETGETPVLPGLSPDARERIRNSLGRS